MKKCISIILTGCLAAAIATTGFAEETNGKNANAGQTVETVQFAAPVDVQSCFIRPILDYDYDREGWYWSNSASAKALAIAIGHVGAMVGGNVELSITRHGNNGSVHEVDLVGNMQNGHFAVMNVAAMAAGDADADAYSSAYASAWESAWAHSSSSSFAQGWSYFSDYFLAGAYGSSHAYSSSSSSAYGYAYADSDAESDAAAEAYAVSSDSNATNVQVSVKGANIKEFEGSLNMNGYSFTYLRASAIADVLAEAYARTYARAYASAYVDASTSASSSIQICSYIWWWNWCYTLDRDYDYDYAYDSAYRYLRDSDDLRALADAHAEAVAAALATSQLSVNLGVQYKNLPGTEDLLTATGNTSAVLQCASYTDADADALVEVQ